MNTVLIFAGILIIAFAVLYLFTRSQIRNIPVTEDNKYIIKLTDKNFDHQTKNRVVLVDFWAGWCVPCRMMAPVLNDTAEELNGEVFVGKVDVEQFVGLAQKYNIRNIPTMVLFKNGKEINRFVGIKNKEFLINQIRKVI